MAQRTTGVRAILSFSWAYDLFQNALGARNSRRRIVDEIIKPSPNQRLLDIGCGTAAILEFLPNLQYVGIDLSPTYINSARNRHGSRGEFHVGRADELELFNGVRFDIALAVGLLHHLDDDEVRQLLFVAYELLVPFGRLITIDPTYAADQHPLARWLVKADRGLNVRTEAELVALTRVRFDKVKTTVRHDLLRIPYTHLIMECTR